MPPGQPHPQSWPGAQPPQVPRSGPHQAQPFAPQPVRDGRAPQAPRPAQAQAAQSQPMPPRPAPPQTQFQPQPQPEPMPVDAEFDVSPGLPVAEPAPAKEPKRRRPALLKWALGALIVAVVAGGLWFALSRAPVTPGLQSPGGAASDPDDPRSRKADKLPIPPGG
jgi:hypothetical protein